MFRMRIHNTGANNLKYIRIFLDNTGTLSVAEPVLFGRSRCKGPAPGSGSTIAKIDEIIKDILFVSFHINKRLF